MEESGGMNGKRERERECGLCQENMRGWGERPASRLCSPDPDAAESEGPAQNDGSELSWSKLKECGLPRKGRRLWAQSLKPVIFRQLLFF
jgi:hypothetical protein